MGVNYIHFIIGETLLLVEIFHFEGVFFATLLLRNTSHHFLYANYFKIQW